MKRALRADLEKLKELAFERVADRRELIEGYHGLSKAARRSPDFFWLEKIYGWAFVPLSLWPVDLRGFGLHILGAVKAGRELDDPTRAACKLFQHPPSEAVCKAVSEYEHRIKTGSYEELIEAQHKFDAIERQLCENQELMADWAEMKRIFDVKAHQNKAGVVRRRPVQERNFHSRDWKFAWGTERERFQNVFDVFCHKWDLYGMERDRPLLLKLTVNLTAYGTMILIPRYWSFDPKRDLRWKEIKGLHRLRSALKQGSKLSVNEAERRAEAERAKAWWEQAEKVGLKGDQRNQWVMGRLGWDPRTDDSKLRRLLRLG